METRLFLGMRLTPEIRVQLSDFLYDDLKRVPHEGKEYLGLYMEARSPSLSEIKARRDHLVSVLNNHFPGAKVSLILFPELFLS